MGQLARVTVSIEPELLARLDAWVAARGLGSRSQALREVLLAQLSEHDWEETEDEIAATISFVYDHHKRELTERLTHIQHTYLGEVIASLHVHIDHQHCLEVLAVRGAGREVARLARELLSVPGVLRGQISPAVRVKLLEDRRDHRH